MEQSKTTIGFVSAKTLGATGGGPAPHRDAVIVPVYMDQTGEITGDLALDTFIKGQMTKRDHKATRGNILNLTAPETLVLTDTLNLKNIIVVGMGNKAAPPSTKEVIDTIAKKTLQELGRDKTALVLGAKEEAVDLADAMLRGSYIFDTAKSGKLGHKPSKLHIDFAAANPKCKEKAFAPRRIVTEASQWVATLATTPSNKLTPGIYADEIKETLRREGVTVEVMSEADSVLPEERALFERMGGLNAVGKGSKNGWEQDRKPHAVIMEYDGTGGSDVKPVVLIGKGVMFDSGGISLKPGANMGDMKMDMHGSATVVGTIRALAAMKAPVKVHAVVGLVENMPDGNAIKPGDVITQFNGMTTEIDNTDAEGRLVLVDGMGLAQHRWGADNIAAMVDVATLTGAIVNALGSGNAGLFSNNDTMASQISVAGEQTHNPVWRMPMTKEHLAAVRANTIADQKNSGVDGPGSSTAAAFLWGHIDGVDMKEGVGKFPWTHLDIAGMAYGKDKIATGYGVHLLTKWITDNYATAKPQSCAKHNKGCCDPQP